MLIPYRSDVQIYYFPYATIGLIIVNVLLYLVTAIQPDPYGTRDSVRRQLLKRLEEDNSGNAPVRMSEAQREQLRRAAQSLRSLPHSGGMRGMALEYGRFRPWQWVTASYMHGGLLHLLGNMFALWGFGFVVEGKIGWWKYLLLYNAIGASGWACVQLLMLGADEGIALGASLPIFGLIVVAMVWAPTAEMDCILFLFFRPIMFQAPIATIALIMLFLQFAISGFDVFVMGDTDVAVGRRITSEVLHLMGALFGLLYGLAMLLTRRVDCEDADIIATITGKDARTKLDEEEAERAGIARMLAAERNRAAGTMPTVPGASFPAAAPFAESPTAAWPNAAPTPFAPPDPFARASAAGEQYVVRFRAQVAAGDWDGARATFERGESTLLGWTVPEPDFMAYVSGLRRTGNWPATADAMEHYLARYGEREIPVRLALIQILVQQLHRYDAAREQLSVVDESRLDANQRAAFDALQAAAQQG